MHKYKDLFLCMANFQLEKIRFTCHRAKFQSLLTTRLYSMRKSIAGLQESMRIDEILVGGHIKHFVKKLPRFPAGHGQIHKQIISAVTG